MIPVLMALAMLGPYTSAANFSVDLLGTADTRPGTWGFAGAQTWHITFSPPPGYRVRILRVSGDLIAWPKVLAGDPPVAPGSYAGVSLGFQTTAAQGSTRCSPCADNTFLYKQGALDARPTRLDYDQAVDVLLEADNAMVVAVSAWLNTTGYPIHEEPTFTVQFRYEK